MNVAKYIGLFLLKNEQCYVHGLGTLQLLRKAATFDGQHLHPAYHEVIITAGGNVDESLANYIANNEQISITKASNALKDFSADTKNQLQAGNQVSLPHIGKFSQQDGRIGFITASQLQYKAEPIPAQKGISLQHNERPPIPHQPFTLPTSPVNTAMPMDSIAPAMPQVRQYMQKPPETGDRLNWARIIFVLLLLIAMAGGAYYGYMWYMAPKKKTQSQPALTVPETIDEEETAPEADTTLTDSTSIITDSLSAKDTIPATTAATPVTTAEKAKETKTITPVPPPVTNQKFRNLKVVIHTTENKEEAYRLKRNAESKGNQVEVIEEETNYFMVAVKVKTANTNDDRVEDSVSKIYNVDAAFVY